MAKYRYGTRIVEAADKVHAIRKVLAETTYEIGHVPLGLADLSRLGLGLGDVDEQKVAYGRQDLLAKLQWFVDHGVEVTGVDARRRDSTYDDVSGSYRKYIGKNPRARKATGSRKFLAAVRNMDIVVPNEPDPKHLEEVKAEMGRLGAPTVTAVYVEGIGAYVALEGSHRVAAAFELGLVPRIRELRYSDVVGEDGEDLLDPSSWRYGLDLDVDSLADFIDRAWERANEGLLYSF